MALTEIQVRTAKPKASQYKLYDEGGLILLVRPSGGKLWRLKYRVARKEQLLSIGRYPDVGLKDARQRRNAARKLLSAGIDPAKQKRLLELEKARSAANTFKVIAEEMIAKSERDGRASVTLVKARWFLSLLPSSFTGSPVAMSQDAFRIRNDIILLASNSPTSFTAIERRVPGFSVDPGTEWSWRYEIDNITLWDRMTKAGVKGLTMAIRSRQIALRPVGGRRDYLR